MRTEGAFDVAMLDRSRSFLSQLGPAPSFGSGLLGGGAHTPNIFFVDGNNGVDTADGQDPRHPLATIVEALTRVVSGRGDAIFAMPATYAENVVVSRLDYVTLVGVLSGYGRPDIIPSTGLPLLVDRSQGFRALSCRFACDGQDSDVVRQEGNGFLYEDCVFDGASGMGATKGLVRLWCDADDDSYTASEGVIRRSLFRGSPGKGIVLDTQHAAVGVQPTDNLFEDLRFYDGVGEDIFLAATAVAANGLHRTLFKGCLIGGGTAKNKATHVDIQTNKVGTPDTEFIGCFINDDTINTTAVKAAGVGASFIGCYSLDGVVDGDPLD